MRGYLTSIDDKLVVGALASGDMVVFDHQGGRTVPMRGPMRLVGSRAVPQRVMGDLSASLHPGRLPVRVVAEVLPHQLWQLE